MDKIDQLEKDIKSLKIQGATNIALATLEGIAIDTTKSVAERLAYARPCEPLAQNGVRFVFSKPDQSPEYYRNRADEYKRLLESAKEKMARIGSSLIQNGGVYLTHCHSSTVVSMFVKARKEGKRFTIFATETRPKYQGRITAKELLNSGIDDVTFIVDDVAESIIEGQLKHIDMVFIGADLLSRNGFVNKTGSLGIAYATQRNSIPLYCLSILLKYDPGIFSPEIIEQRSGDEIWPDAPAGLQFYAPAFDYIPYRTGVKIVSEEGIIEGEGVVEKAKKLYTFLEKH